MSSYDLGIYYNRELPIEDLWDAIADFKKLINYFSESDRRSISVIANHKRVPRELGKSIVVEVRKELIGGDISDELFLEIMDLFHEVAKEKISPKFPEIDYFAFYLFTSENITFS